MRFGLNTWALEFQVDGGNLDRVFGQIAGLDIPGGKPFVGVFASPDKDDLKFARAIRERAEHYGLGVTACGFNPGDPVVDAFGKPLPHLVSPDEAEREAALERVYGFLDFAAEVATDDLRVLSGPWNIRHKYFDSRATSEQEQEYLLDVLPRIATRAGRADVKVGFEVLNRFESRGLNTVGEALEVVRKVGSKYLGIQWDAAHAYIDEPDFLGSLTAAVESGYLMDVHLCDNHRREFGTGQIGPKTAGILDVLKSGGFSGGVMLELFCPPLYPAVGIWSPPKESPLVVAANSVGYLKRYVNTS